MTDEIKAVFDRAMTNLKAAMDAGPAGVCAILTSEEATAIYRLIEAAFERIKIPFDPIAIVCDGGIVQSVNTDDERLIGKLDILVIDYDVDGAEEVYAVPQVGEADPTLVSEAQLFGVAVTPADGIDLPETWRRYMADEVTLDTAKINAESEGYRVRLVPGSTDRWEWFTAEAVAFVDYEDADAAWMAAYQDLVR